jgi:FtsP/CotA-like multicopper oxidase with cupredoxin domain
MQKSEKKPVGRRDFLRVLAAGAGAAAAGTAAPLAAPAAAAESDQEKRKARYKESEHVKAFYRVNQYPQ